MSWRRTCMDDGPSNYPRSGRSFLRTRWKAFGKRMFTGDFVYSVTRDFVKSCRTPMIVMPGNNLDHPRVIGNEIAALAPNSEIIPDWRHPPELVPPAVARIKTFLKTHTPELDAE